MTNATPPNTPFPASYWVIPGRLLAGEYPAALSEASTRHKLARLADAGVTSFIDLTRPGELPPYAHLLPAGATHARFPIQDLSVPQSPAHMTAILDAIDHALQRGDIIYIHCYAGVGRTGTTVGCYLARHGNPGESALTALSDLWRHCATSAHRQSPETPHQREYVMNWREQPPAVSPPPSVLQCR